MAWVINPLKPEFFFRQFFFYLLFLGYMALKKHILKIF